MKKLVIAGILATLTTTANAMSVEEVVSSKVMTYDVLSTACKMLKKKSRYTKEEVTQLKAFATENKICGYEPEIKVISTKPVISQEPTPTKAELEAKVAMLEEENTALKLQEKTQSDTITKLVDKIRKLENKLKITKNTSPAKSTTSGYKIDSFYTKYKYAYVELNVTKAGYNKIVCRVKNSAGQTIDSDSTYMPTVGWHKQMMILPSENMYGLTVNCQAQ